MQEKGINLKIIFFQLLFFHVNFLNFLLQIFQKGRSIDKEEKIKHVSRQVRERHQFKNYFLSLNVTLHQPF